MLVVAILTGLQLHPREAFFTFGTFAISESKRVWDENDLGGMPHKNGIYDRFKEFVKNNPNAPAIDLLDKIIDYGVLEKSFDKDAFVHELTDGIIGDNYPFPDRMLRHVEAIVQDYLFQEMDYGPELHGNLTYLLWKVLHLQCVIFLIV